MNLFRNVAASIAFATSIMYGCSSADTQARERTLNQVAYDSSSAKPGVNLIQGNEDLSSAGLSRIEGIVRAVGTVSGPTRTEVDFFIETPDNSIVDIISSTRYNVRPGNNVEVAYRPKENTSSKYPSFKRGEQQYEVLSMKILDSE